MSLKTAHLQPLSYLYAAGNTPAVCLTQSLPPDQDASLLLLGCGDIRNILYTAYNNGDSGDRKLDFTCCDLEVEILARNTLALTIIADDTDGQDSRVIWEIYYHTVLSNEALTRLQTHAKKLLHYADSLDQWENSPYGTFIRFADTVTFTKVTHLWKFYATDSSQPKDYAKQQKLLKGQWKSAQKHHNERLGNGAILDGVRAFAPMLSATCFDDAIKQHKAFWKNGTPVNDAKTIRNHIHPNPLFVCLRSGLILHYGTNPLLGFHLAAAYTELSSTSPLKPLESGEKMNKSFNQPLKAALAQFATWCDAFRKIHRQVISRFVNSDAIAFCHVLQHHGTHAANSTSNWYRAAFGYQPLVLDAQDYRPGGVAPSTFDVIDTSNLIDHLGSLNVLSAASPLLSAGPSSVLRTEMLVPREATVADSAKSMLCGDLPTVALLLGLKPIQYWTNSTASWNPNESILNDAPHASTIINILSRQVILWKAVSTSMIRYESQALAQLVYQLYLEMFQDESWERTFSMLGLQANQRQRKITQYDLYTRVSLSALLQHVRNSEVVDWDPFINSLIDKILNDPKLNMGPHYLQSLFVHLYTLGLSNLQRFDWFHSASYLKDTSKGPLKGWKDIPAVVCVTLVVPRSAVSLFRSVGDGFGSPICHLQLQSSITNGQCIFPDVQMGFGNISTTGQRSTNSYKLNVQDDEEGWEGKGSLIVSALVSTCFLVEHGDTACGVHFALKSVPATALLTPTLGLELAIHKSQLGHADVFVTKHRPNMRGNISIGSRKPVAQITDSNWDITIHPVLASQREKVTSLRVHCKILSEDIKNLLQKPAIVEIHLRNPFCLVFEVGKGQYYKHVRLPIPLVQDRGKSKIARKSSWLEYSAPISDMGALNRRADMVFPMHIDSSFSVLLEHLHYVSPDVLPTLQIGKVKSKLQWLTPTTATKTTMADFEWVEYERSLQANSTPTTGRLGMKDSLFCIFTHVSGLQEQPQANIFALNDPSAGGTHIGLLVSAIRMDLSNQSVFLDAAAISLSEDMLVEYVRAFEPVQRRGPVVTVNINDAELKVWKHVLPAFAERCRDWKHKSGCEYRAKGSIPLSTNFGERFMCNCGLDIFPAEYLNNLKEWKHLSKFATRVAIPVCYASPIHDSSGVAIPTSAYPQRASDDTHLGRTNTTATRIEDLDAKKGACFECGAKTGKGSKALLKCAACKHAQYCSPHCQKKNWTKEHRSLCKQLKGLHGDS